MGSVSRRVLSPKHNPLSPTPSANRNIGTPPPHPATPPLGMRRVSSPLARSHSPATERKSLIPQLSPGAQRKKPSSLNVHGKSSMSSGQGSSGPVSPSSAEMRSLIPRVQTPPALRKMYPKDGSDKLANVDRNVVRKQTYNKDVTGDGNSKVAPGEAPTSDASNKTSKPAISSKPAAS